MTHARQVVIRQPNLLNRGAVLAAFPRQLYDHPHRVFAQQRLDRLNNALVSPDLDQITNLEWQLTVQVPSGDHVVGVSQFEEVVDPSHEGQDDTCLS